MFCSGIIIGYVIGISIKPYECSKEIEKIILNTKPLKKFISRGSQYKINNIEEESESESYGDV